MKGVACSQLSLLNSVLNKCPGNLQIKDECFQIFLWKILNYWYKI